MAMVTALSKKIFILHHRGLRFHNLVAGWVCHRIQPLQPWPRLLHTYIGITDDLLWGSKATWDFADFTSVMKKLIKDDIRSFDVPGRAPFWMFNEYFSVRHPLTCSIEFSSSHLC
jgi:hypothetical protein